MFKHILVTLDGSPYSERALSYVTDLATLAQARVTLLMVASEDPSPLHPAATADDARAKVYHTYLDGHVERLRAAGIKDVDADVRSGLPARTIADVARELQVDLIAMSTQGVGAETDQGLGSVASKVLMLAPCPVFMVRIHRPAPPRGPAEERWQAEGGANVG